jgi:3-hydroxyisobutyrate dehydrogenase-like beta-hydroxyacid dehydrogenase
MSSVGIIGLGTMGARMARNLIKAGHQLSFVARRPEVAQEFTALGGRRYDTPAEVTREAEFVITIVTADAEVCEVALGPQGILAGAAPGKTYLEMSTIGPWTVRQLGQRFRDAGMAMLDAPVSGGPWGAEAGTLTIMCGGEADDVARCRPVFEAIGKRVFHIGPLGAGQTVKLVNQMMAGAIMALVAEGFVLAKAAGADVQAMADVVAVSSGGSTMFDSRAKQFILADQYVAGFKTELMRKDVRLALEMAGQLDVALPVASAAYQQYLAALKSGHAELDFASVIKVYEQAAGLKVVDAAGQPA